MAIRLAAVLVALVVATTVNGCSRSLEPIIEDCAAGSVDEDARCFHVAVRESPGTLSRRTLRVRVAVLPSTGGPRVHEPLLLLQGGPGAAGTDMARNFPQRTTLREGRDLVFVDQRGTIGSGALNCAFLGRHNFLGALFPPDHVRDCRQALESRADLSTYTNTISADDLDAVRKAIGVESWSVMGFSFGTRLAQSYARQYPTRVRAVILDGVVPFDAQLTADLAQSMERSLDYVLARCERDEECRARYPGARQTLGALAAKLDEHPVPIEVTDAFGRTLTGWFGRWELAYAVRGMLYGNLAASLPGMLRLAEQTGDLNEFARIYWNRSRWVGDSTSLALHLGVYCSEDMPFTDSTDAVRRAQGTLIGARYYQEYRRGCASWPMPRASDELRRPWTSDIPVLLFSGERDPVTPPGYGEQVLRGLTRGQHFVIRGGGHSEQSDCKESLVAQFLASPGRPVDRACLELLDFPRFR